MRLRRLHQLLLHLLRVTSGRPGVHAASVHLDPRGLASVTRCGLVEEAGEEVSFVLRLERFAQLRAHTGDATSPRLLDRCCH